VGLSGNGGGHPIRLWQMVTRTLSSLLRWPPSDLLYVLEEDGRKKWRVSSRARS